MDSCPVCNRQIAVAELEAHVNVCLDDAHSAQERVANLSRDQLWQLSAAALPHDGAVFGAIEPGASQLNWPNYARDMEL
jgi:hypothetical protein